MGNERFAEEEEVVVVVVVVGVEVGVGVDRAALGVLRCLRARSSDPKIAPRRVSPTPAIPAESS